MDRETGRVLLLGMIAGGVGAGILMLALGKTVDTQLERVMRQTIDREVPPRVRAELDAKMAELGLTEATALRIRRVLDAASSLGVL